MRMPTQKELDRRYTCGEYLALIDQLEGKFELRDGRLTDYRAMAGASDAHALIAANVTRTMGNAVFGGPCRVYSSDLIIRIPRTTNYRFGDVVVVCGPIEFDPDDTSKNKAVMNPKVIVEIASPSTKLEDHADKFHQYQLIESFEEYVLIEQGEPYVQTRRRQPDGTWIMSFFRGREGRVALRSLGIELAMSEIFAGVEFPPPPVPAIDGQTPRQ